MTAPFIHDRLAQTLFARDEDAGLDDIRAKLDGLALLVTLEPGVAREPWAQAAAMAIAACGSRMFRGGIFFPELIATPTIVGDGLGQPLRRSLERRGIRVSGAPPASAFRLHVGFDKLGQLNVAVRGWTAIVSPRAISRSPVSSNVITGSLAGALAVSEAFRRTALGSADAGRIVQEINAWEPGSTLDLDGTIKRLPRDLWLIGLGNLGQASLFLLPLLPFADRAAVRLMLQDFDRSGPENLDTQILTGHDWVGKRKAANAATSMEALGFDAFGVARRFAPGQGPRDGEPSIALIGVDNVDARRAAAGGGFAFAVDAGLGTSPAEIFDVAVHAFPGGATPLDVWPEAPPTVLPDILPERFEKLIEAGVIDRCGAITIAGQAVGVPSTALCAAALQIAQVCRALATGGYCDRIDLRTARTADAASTRANGGRVALPSSLPARP